MDAKELLKKIYRTDMNRLRDVVIKNFFIAFVFCVSLLSTGQNRKWSVEGNFPYTFGDNFVDEGYNGVADLGLKYRIREYRRFDLGASLNMGAFTSAASLDGSNGINGNAILFQPRAFASYIIDSVPGLHPMVGLGYSLFMFNVNDENFNNANFQQNRSDDGLNLNVAIAYDLTDALFVQVQYDYIRLSARNSIDSSYNKNVNIIKLGFGYRF